MMDWLEFEEKMNRLGGPLSQETREDIRMLEVVKDIGRAREANEISEETSKKAAFACYEYILQMEKRSE